MTDIVPSTERTREGGGSSSAIQCPMLTDSNYTVWAIRMKSTLRVHKVWDTIEQNSTEAEPNNTDKDIMAMALLFQSIPEALVLQVGDLGTAKKVWEAIRTRHVGAERVKEARLQTLMTEFDRLKMKETETIDTFGGKIATIASKASALGENIKEVTMVKKFLKSLPRKKYIHIVASLEQVLDLNTTTFENIVGRLKAYEERITEEEEETSEVPSKLMYTNTDVQPLSTSYANNETTGSYRGRGRGRFHYRGRGRGRYNGGTRDITKVTCYRCDKTGHYASDCPDRLLKLQEAEETQDDDTQKSDELMMHEIVFLNEDRCVPSKYETSNREQNIWYLDNGASNHMTGDGKFFTNLDRSITGKVRFGDDSRIEIMGKGNCSKYQSFQN